MPTREIAFQLGEYYHLYNRGVNRKHLLPVLEVVAYCLMPTHYHLLVHVKQTPQTSEERPATG